VTGIYRRKFSMTAELENNIAGHYTTDNLLSNIKAALIAAGRDPDNLRPQDLKGVDEFHTGGVQATDDLLEQLTITGASRIVDIGCGIGGAARHIATATGAVVTGVDVTADYIETAEALSQLVGMHEQTRFMQGSALNMPLADRSFDLATMFHVGMNIEDKPALFHEAARVLTPQSTFALFDIMRFESGDLTFPFPWAEQAEWSFVAPPATYINAAQQAGFELIGQRKRRDFTLAFFEKAFAAIKESGAPPPVGIHLLMKDTAALKLKNYVAEVKADKLAPVELIFRKM
jgi:ubiquinone/menaquinone biosynthesis C-methylase UbiE